VPPQVGQALFATAQQMRSAPDAPIRALGRVLSQILTGERSPDLSDLPDGLTEAIRTLLASLGS
jgi:hypothetical protein